MKAKTIIISLATLGIIAGGGVFAALHFSSAAAAKVEVVPVANINSGWWGFDEDTIEGNIISKDTQNVDLNGEYALVKVYVQEGDTVKAGDPLLEYDMTMEQLKLEMAELTGQRLDLELSTEERYLEKLLKQPGAQAIYAKIERSTESEKTRSADDIQGEDEDSAVIDEDEVPDDPSVTSPVQEPAGEAQETSPSGGGDEEILDDADLIEDDDLVYEDFDDDALIRVRLTEFLSTEELIRTYQYEKYRSEGDISVLNEENISGALALYEEELSAMPDEKLGTIDEFRDAFGDLRRENKYVLSTQVREALAVMEKQYAGTDTPFYAASAESSLYKAYLNLMLYDLQVKMARLDNVLTTAQTDPENAPEELLTVMRSAIIAAADSYYRFDVNRKLILQILEKEYGLSREELRSIEEELDQAAVSAAGENMKLGDTSDGLLSRLIARLNDAEMLEPETEGETDLPQSEPWTDDYDNYGDYDGYDDFDPDDDPESLEEELRSARADIEETKRSIRENELAVKKYKRTLAGQIVRAAMDGIVKSAGEVDEAAQEAFIVITGESGMYVTGTVGELDLETIKVGDVVTGTSWENGASFTAVITEVSEYPETGMNDYYGFSMGTSNSNVSRYPFTAYIEDADDIVEGSVQMQFESRTVTDSIYLDNAFVRTDEQGKDYVFIADGNGLLKKQIVSTAVLPWGGGLQIKSGLTLEDKIAFPYGKGVAEGAQTVEVDNFDSLYM